MKNSSTIKSSMTDIIRFYNDYSEGAHPRILRALQESNLQSEAGYGEDSFCQEAAKRIQKAIKNDAAAVHFVSGGTQANKIVLAACLRPYESVIAVNSAHIAVHEAGAIEETGHKINTVMSLDGRIRPEQIQAVCDEHTDEHMVKPRVVFVSQSTEVGTVYTKHELQAIAEVCTKNELYLYLDGARLGSGLVASGMSLAEIAEMVDLFYIGGTKNGALLGEAIVIVNPELQKNFRYHLKQHGALLAKGRVLGVQFAELFRDGLYFELAQHANEMAERLSAGIRDLGYGFLTESRTNQIFPILPNTVIEKLQEKYGFYVWSKVDEQHSSIRLVTSWATKSEAVEGFLEELGVLGS